MPEQTAVYPPNVNKYCLAEERPHFLSVRVSGRLKGNTLLQHHGQTLSHYVNRATREVWSNFGATADFKQPQASLFCWVLNFIVTEIRAVRDLNSCHIHKEPVFVKEERKSFLL